MDFLNTVGMIAAVHGKEKTVDTTFLDTVGMIAKNNVKQQKKYTNFLYLATKQDIKEQAEIEAYTYLFIWAQSLWPWAYLSKYW